MTDLRTVVAKLATFRCAWTCEEIQALTDAPIRGVRAYLTALVNQQVLIRTEHGYMPGPRVQAWKKTPPKTKGPSTYGNSAAYRAQRAVWDVLRQRDWKEGRKGGGKGQVLTSTEEQQDTVDHNGGQQMPSVSHQSAPLTIQEAAQLLGCHANTVRNLISRGKIRTYRVSERVVRILRSEVDRYHAQGIADADKA